METVEISIPELLEAFREDDLKLDGVPQEAIADCSEKEKAMLAGFIYGFQYSEMLNTRVTLSASSTADDVKSCTE